MSSIFSSQSRIVEGKSSREEIRSWCHVESPYQSEREEPSSRANQDVDSETTATICLSSMMNDVSSSSETLPSTSPASWGCESKTIINGNIVENSTTRNTPNPRCSLVSKPNLQHPNAIMHHRQQDSVDIAISECRRLKNLNQDQSRNLEDFIKRRCRQRTTVFGETCNDSRR